MIDEFYENKIKDGFKFIFDNELCYFAVDCGSGKILIFINNLDLPLNPDEFKITENIGHLIGYYLNKLEKTFIEIFKDNSIDPSEITISVHADSYVRRSLLLDNELADKVNSKNPIYFETNLIENNLEITVIYSLESIESMYDPYNNSFEQYIMNQLIFNIYSELKPIIKDQIRKKTEQIIEKNIPNGKPGFTLEKLRPINERTINYSPPLKKSVSSENKVKKLIEGFFKNELKIKPGKYSGEDLKQILNKAFGFIQSELEKEMEKFDKNSSIHFIYAQIEFLKNYRESTEITLGKAPQTYTEYDIVEKKVELLDDTVMRNNIFQHMIETILKLNNKTENAINTSDFQYLESLAMYACEFSYISDYLHYKILPHEMIIENDYSFNINKKATFHGDEYIINHSKKALKYDSIKYERAKNEPEYELDSNGFESEYKDINEAFEIEFGFKYTDLLVIMFAMGVTINPSDTACYPMVYIDQDSLINELKKAAFIDDISDSTLIKMLNFISLPYETFKEIDPFIPNLLRMNENRFSLKPLLKFSTSEEIYYLYGVLSVYSTCGIYSHKISTGRFPYRLKKGEIETALKLMESNHNKELEKEVDKLASKIFGHENIKSNLKKFKQINESFPNKPECGEIDCLVVDKKNKVIYVLEAKDVVKANTPKELRKEFNKFFDPNNKKNYSKKLLKKVKFVSENLDQFLEYFKVSNKDNWDLKFAFVTYEVHLSAFHKVNNIEFIPLTELENYFQKD
jgi:hypothetical protein